MGKSVKNNIAQVICYILDEDDNECLVITNVKDNVEVYLGNYSFLHEYDDFSTGAIKTVHFENSIILLEETAHSVEIPELEYVIGKLIKKHDLVQLSDDQYKSIVQRAIKKFNTKNLIGMKASMLTIDYCKLEIIINEESFTFYGPVENPLFIDEKNMLCIHVSNKDSFLVHLLDDVFVDITTIMKFKEALRQMKWIANILTLEKQWKCKNVDLLLDL